MGVYTPDTSMIKDARERALFLMAWRVCWTFIILFTILSIGFFFYSIETFLTYIPIALISGLSVLYLYKTRNPKPVFWMVAIAGAVISQISFFLLPDTLPYSNFTWVSAGVVFVYATIGRSAGFIYAVLNIAGYTGYFMFGLDNHLRFYQPVSPVETAMVFVEVGASVGIIVYIMNQYVIFQRNTALQLRKTNLHLEEQNDAILMKNKENITLVKEIHHRVKNNLQIIISLLRMQRNEASTPESKQQFDEMITRVMTMSMIHQRLYQEKEASRINLGEYLSDLCDEILSLSRLQNVKVNVTSELDFIDLKSIVPIGLLINELVSNSVKHAFPGKEEQSINIDITMSGKELKLVYQDSGEWKPAERESNSFGLELIDVLTEQLDGTYEREGSRYTFELSPFED